MESSAKIEMDKICRVCNSSEDLNNLFIDEVESEVSDNKLDLPSQIMACCTVDIFLNDGLPNKICGLCANEVKKAYQFKVRCEQNDAQMREYLRSTTSGCSVQIMMHKKKNKIKLEDSDDYEITIKPEITLIEDIHDDPLNQLWKKLNLKKTGENDDDDESDDGRMDQSMDNDEDDDESQDEKDTKQDLLEELAPPVKSKKGPPVKVDHIDLENYNFDMDKDGKYACKLCDKKLADKKGLKLHLRLHTGEKLKVCKICDRGFLKPHHLLRHMETHNHKCEDCDKSFLNINEYRVHMKEFHPATKRSKLKKIKKEPIEEMPKAIYRQPEGKIVQCRICDANFKHIYEIRNHLNLHLDVNTFDAIDLQTKYFLFDPRMMGVVNETKETLISYITNEIAGGDKARLYDIFNRSSGQELNLTDSETESESEQLESVDQKLSRYTQRKHQCSICKESFDRIYKIMQHLTDTHAEDAYGFKDRCKLCNKVFPNEFILNRHSTTQCGNIKKMHKCEGCKIKFMWEKNLKLHRKQCPQLSPKEKCRSGQDGQLTCELCQKTFQRYEYLKRHMQTHLPNEKKFECPECQKKFNRKDNLRSHLKTHSKDPELPMPDGQLCVYCGRNFSNSSNLIVHMRRHTGEKPYKCEFCDKGFPRSSDLQCHRRTHTGEKPCLCTICGKGFSRSNKLVRHMRIHTGSRPYQCPHCDRAFTQSNDLTLHIRRHTGERPYVCGVCGDRFIQGTALKAHQKAQQHFDDSKKESPFASISVNNPNRFSNTNHVARISDGGTPLPIKILRAKSQKNVKVVTLPPLKLETQISLSNDTVSIGDRSNSEPPTSLLQIGGLPNNFSVPFPMGLSNMETLFTISQHYNQSHYNNSHHNSGSSNSNN